MSSDKKTRASILDATLELLQKDPQRVNISRIAKAAEISRQGLYLHFDGTAALLLAAARRVDDRLDLEKRVRPLLEADNAEELLFRYATFLAEYNPLIYPVVRSADAIRATEPHVQRAWMDRLANRRQGARTIAKRLKAWGRLATGWSVPTAGDWLAAQGGVKIWEELVMDLGWSRKRYVESMTRAFKGSLLAH